MKGTIKETRVEADYNDQDKMKAVFVIDTPSDGLVKAKYKCWPGDHEEKTKKVFELLGLSYPNDLVTLTEPKNDVIGAEVDVFVGDFNGHAYARIKTGAGGPIDRDDVLARLKGEAKKPTSGDVPF